MCREAHCPYPDTAAREPVADGVSSGFQGKQLPQKAKERVAGEGKLSSLLSFYFLEAPGPAVWGYGLWGSVGWDRAIF